MASSRPLLSDHVHHWPQEHSVPTSSQFALGRDLGTHHCLKLGKDYNLFDSMQRKMIVCNLSEENLGIAFGVVRKDERKCNAELASNGAAFMETVQIGQLLDFGKGGHLVRRTHAGK